MAATDKLTPRIKLWLNGEEVDGVFGDGKCRLLQSIETTGSLRAASELLHISYRQASLGVALIDQHRGGPEGGRTVLTEQGKRWLDAYHRFRRDVEAAVQASFEKFIGEVG